MSSKELKGYIEQELHKLEKIRPGSDLTAFSNRLITENVELIQISDLHGESNLHEKLVRLILLHDFV